VTKELQMSKALRDLPIKGATPAEVPATESGNRKGTEEKAKKTIRPRKWDYGIHPHATIVRVEGKTDETPVKGDVKAQWLLTTNKPSIQSFLATKSCDRHGLRVMSRRGLINIIHADGSVYPKKMNPELHKVEAVKADKATATTKA
tara:strand:+ start:1317 stop:1754 length:438 start_codon:yes stop_codon:yes gene_type:complete